MSPPHASRDSGARIMRWRGPTGSELAAGPAFRDTPGPRGGPPMNRMLQGALAEFFGTMLFVFVAAGAIIANKSNVVGSPLMIAAANGLSLGLAITCFLYISGGQLNPAVS